MMVTLIITRQLERLGANRNNLPDAMAFKFIDNVHNALRLGVGPEFAEKAKRLMRDELRKWKPQLFQMK